MTRIVYIMIAFSLLIPLFYVIFFTPFIPFLLRQPFLHASEIFVDDVLLSEFSDVESLLDAVFAIRFLSSSFSLHVQESFNHHVLLQRLSKGQDKASSLFCCVGHFCTHQSASNTTAEHFERARGDVLSLLLP